MSEREPGTRDIGACELDERAAELGIPIDADVRSELITTIFYPGTELHDGALIVQQGRIAAAGSLFPLSENPELGSWAGTRHRAAVGLTEETDAITLVVSEERGEVSLCIRGQVHRNLDRDELERQLRTYYAQKEEGTSLEPRELPAEVARG
ncbi:MAG: diadenylate cyclase [Planctomycetota bacterium]